MRRRCDQLPNCRDSSDEKNCQLIILDEGYNKDVPPFQMNYPKDIIIPAKVSVSIDLFNVMSIDEVENTIDLKFGIKMEWYDRRLTYNNLKQNRTFLNKLNETDMKSIWLPLITYNNTDQFQTTRLAYMGEWTTRVVVLREHLHKR